MSLGLTSVLALFQKMMDSILKDMKEGIQYLDNIFICGGNAEVEYQAIVESELQQYAEHGLTGNQFESEFYIKKTIFLGHVINGKEVKTNAARIKTIYKWPIPIKKKEVQAFLNFADYCHRFMVNYSAKVQPIIDCTKDIPFTCVCT